MKHLHRIVVLAITLIILSWRQPVGLGAGKCTRSLRACNQESGHSRIPGKRPPGPRPAQSGDPGIRRPAYLNIHDMQQTGRTYGFYHGRPSDAGALFWRFVEYPDKERLEVTKERDVAYVYTGDKGYEVTYKGRARRGEKGSRRLPAPPQIFFGNHAARLDQRSQRGPLLRWHGSRRQPRSAAGYAHQFQRRSGQALFRPRHSSAAQEELQLARLRWTNSATIEEEIYDNYKPVQGVMTPYSFTRYYNGDMQSQRFLNTIQYNQGLDPAMFDPNSGYNPNKVVKKH